MFLLPVQLYHGQNNAWMTFQIFHTWFHDSFVPAVSKELSSLGLEKSSVLVLDVPAHPNVEDLTNGDGKITAHYLPPNVISLIHQAVFEALVR